MYIFSLVHSFIINPRDSFVKSLFTGSELEEIITTPYGAKVDEETSENIDDLLNYICFLKQENY